MRTFKPGKLLWMLSVLLLILINSSCITIRDATECSVAGKLSAGGICTHLLTPDKSVMTFEEFVTFLEPDAATKKGGAICMSADDWGTMKTELEVACRMLGNRCSLQTKKLLQKLP